MKMLTFIVKSSTKDLLKVVNILNKMLHKQIFSNNKKINKIIQMKK